MSSDAKKWLADIRDAAETIAEFTRGKSRDDYDVDAMLRSAVQWQFTVIGEAMSRLLRDAPELAAQVSEHRRIVAFRNQILHGYDVIRDEITWQVVEEKLPILHREVSALLEEADDGSDPPHALKRAAPEGDAE